MTSQPSLPLSLTFGLIWDGQLPNTATVCLMV